ncbi:hypothetical protein KBC04_01915 [Candidatus Babeliales bacterium]|nr:hypothetical protein [Candidatus Babeliales bacterium]MBP9843527.1 hypothetical protein [Candidatus Babeliales bacterium]
MSKLDNKKIVNVEQEVLSRLILKAEEAFFLYGFYWIVAGEMIPKIFASQAFQKIEEKKRQYQAQRFRIKWVVEDELVLGYQNLKKDLTVIQDYKIEQHIKLIDIQVNRCQNTRVGWEHVYLKIQALLKDLWVIYKQYQLVLKYAKVEQKFSSIDFVIGNLLFVPSWKKMQEIELMFISDQVADVSVAVILLDGLLKYWNNTGKDKKNIFDLDIDVDLQLFLISMQQDYEEFMLLHEKQSKHQGNMLFFTKAKILSSLRLVLDSMFAEENKNDIDISPSDEFNIFPEMRRNRAYLFLEIISLKVGIPILYILHEFKEGGESHIFKLTCDIFCRAKHTVIDIHAFGKEYQWNKLSWTTLFSKIQFQLFEKIVFQKTPGKNCKNFVGAKFSGSDLSSVQRAEIAKKLSKLPRLES